MRWNNDDIELPYWMKCRSAQECLPRSCAIFPITIPPVKFLFFYLSITIIRRINKHGRRFWKVSQLVLMTAPKVFLLCVTFRVFFFSFFHLYLSTDMNAATSRRARRIPPTFASIFTHTSYLVRERKRVYRCCNIPPQELADSMTMRDEDDGTHFCFVLFSGEVGLSTCLFGGRFGSVVGTGTLCQYYYIAMTKNALQRRQEWIQDYRIWDRRA